MDSPSSPLSSYRQRCGAAGLWNADTPLNGPFEATFEQRYRQLRQQEIPPVVMLAERRPEIFLASFLAACAADCPVALANPDWTDRERQMAQAMVQPSLIWRDGVTVSLPQAVRLQPISDRLAPDRRCILIPTGGTSGRLKFAIHAWETLSASVQGFCRYFGCSTVNACCTLPLYHVSGLMQFMRCWLSGGQLVFQPWRSLTHPLPFDPDAYFLSLVPSQLQELIAHPAAVDTLRRFSAILLGGAPAWPTLLDQGRSLRLPLAPTYGMTETASQVATLKPQDFLAGQTGCGVPLPHARISILDPQGNPTAGVGRIAIAAESLYWGYSPDVTYPASIETDDLGYLEDGALYLVGRQSDAIISGGENIFPAEVEAAIRGTGLVEDVAVVGVEDGRWGETPVALYVPRHTTSRSAPADIKAALRTQLSRYKHPSHWIALADLPRSPQGKLDRVALRAIALAEA